MLARTTRIVASAEAKATETAEIVAAALGLTFEVEDDTGENDRSATAFLPKDAFEVTADRFFARRKAHFQQVGEGRSENLKRKDELIARAEALADSSEWHSRQSFSSCETAGRTKSKAPARAASARNTKCRFLKVMAGPQTLHDLRPSHQR